MKVKIKKLFPDAVIPTYAHPGDAGMDLVAHSYEYDKEHDCFVYGTGISIEPPEGYVILLFPRSSNKKTECYLANHVGVVDQTYRGEIKMVYKNRDHNYLSKPYNVGDRIGQMLILPYPQIEFEEVEDLNNTDRGSGGFGSTGN